MQLGTVLKREGVETLDQLLKKKDKIPRCTPQHFTSSVSSVPLTISYQVISCQVRRKSSSLGSGNGPVPDIGQIQKRTFGPLSSGEAKVPSERTHLASVTPVHDGSTSADYCGTHANTFVAALPSNSQPAVVI